MGNKICEVTVKESNSVKHTSNQANSMKKCEWAVRDLHNSRRVGGNMHTWCTPQFDRTNHERSEQY